jgi:peptidyl-prolyl cis-trans isomerase A (cyclophilin A)
MKLGRWCIALVAVAAWYCAGCEHKSSKQDMGNAATSSTNSASGSAMVATGNTASGSPSEPPRAAKTDEVKPEPVAKEPEPAPSADAVAPTAGDLDGYVKALPGSGKLLAKIETSMGTFHCELFGDKSPVTVANFVGLATGKKPWKNPKTGEVVTNTPYFDGLTFHRVIPGFMIQGGDPLGVGMGGPGYVFDNEVDPSLKMEPGTLAMANAGIRGGHGTNGSQFFITEVSRHELDGGYTIFGRCKEPDLVKKIAAVPRDGEKPQTPVTILHVTISRG